MKASQPKSRATGRPEGQSGRFLPKTVWALGFTSLFMDVSSELIHGLLPVFLVVTLGASAAALGIIEGIAEATAHITRVFSGWLSDRLQRRKALAVAGYGLAAVTKPLFPLASAVWLVALARFLDRIGKGIRGAPRDALVADVTAPETRGAAFGLRQALDTVGATLGPLLAIGLMLLFSDNIRAVLWFAVIPAAISVLILLIFVQEPPHRQQDKGVPIQAREIGQLGWFYWVVVAVGAVFTLARFSEAFLVIRAHDQGLSLALTPAVIAVMSLVYAVAAYPAGRLQDRYGARPLLLAGLAALIAADLLLALGGGLFPVFLGIGLWGLHMGLTQGVLSALVAEAAPARLRGTAFGLFGLSTGLAALTASILAGLLWDGIGPDATFLAGGGFAALALIGFLALRATPGET
ncbi:MFS transporter [Methyloligella sp. 2.7D]|uniref:MFS transporter n=1 Tax=unclassified Methyloligella TaxID=2625955 RepID=UPI00157DD341|nr:MFS transporter [Methyloligella sp. GL2]QKP76421.1 MFS transporter [Methyloligella sp. GL2]